METVLTLLGDLLFGVFSVAAWLLPFVLAVAIIDRITRKDHTSPPKPLPEPVAKLWLRVRTLFGRVNRRVGLSLPLVIVWYVWLLLPEGMALCEPHRAPVFGHAGIAEGGMMMLSALLILLVLPTAIYDLWRRQWFALLAVPLVLGLFFIWDAGFQLLIDTGRVVLHT